MRRRAIGLAALSALWLACGKDRGELLHAESGGLVRLGSEAQLSVPPGALPADTRIAIERLDRVPEADAGGFHHFGQAYRLTPAGTAFDLAHPASFTLQLDRAALEAKGLEPRTLVVHWLDEKAHRWFAVPTQFDADTGRITASLEHFTIYAALAQTSVPGNQPPVLQLVGTVPATPRANAPLLVRVLARDFDSGGAIAGVACIYDSGGDQVPVKMARDLSVNTLELWGGVIPASAMPLSPRFLLRCLAVDNLGAANLVTSAPFSALVSIDASTLALSPGTQNMSAGSSRYFSITAKDTNGATFPVVPDGRVALDVGTVDAPVAAGLLVHAQKTGSGVLSAQVGQATLTSAVTVFNGAIQKLEMLNGAGQPISGALTVKEGARTAFDVRGLDAFGNQILVLPWWQADPGVGQISGGMLDSLDASGSGRAIASLAGTDLTAVQWVNVLPRSWSSLGRAWTAPQALGGTPALAASPAGLFALFSDENQHARGARLLPLSGWAVEDLSVTGQPAYGLVATSGAGGVFGAWTENGTAYVRFSAGGGWLTLGGPLRLNPTALVYQVKIGFGGGTPWVAWIETLTGLRGGHAYAARWDGARWVMEGGSLEHAGMQAYDLSIAVAASGTPFVALVESDGHSAFPLYVKRWTGAAWEDFGGASDLAQGDGTQSFAPSIALQGESPVIAAEALLNGASGIVAWSYLFGWQRIQVSDALDANPSGPSLAIDGNRAWISWRSQSGEPLSLRHSTDNIVWKAYPARPTAPFINDPPALAVLPEGPVVSWTQTSAAGGWVAVEVLR